MNILLEAIHELNKLEEKWEEPLIDLSDLSQYPYISHFTKTVKNLFCILESGVLKSGGEDNRKTNKEYAVCFSYVPYIEYERDPEKFKYGIIFNTDSFKKKLEEVNLKWVPYHATAKKLNSGNKELRIKYIGKKDSNYFLNFGPYDFSTPISISVDLYEKIKNHMLYLEKINKEYWLIKQKEGYTEFFGYQNAAKGQNLYLTSNDNIKKNYRIFERLLPVLLDDAFNELLRNSQNVKIWKLQSILKKYDIDYSRLGFDNINLKKINKDELTIFTEKFMRFIFNFKRSFDDNMIWITPEQADEVYINTDEAEIRVTFSKEEEYINFTMNNIHEIFIPQRIDYPEDYENYQKELNEIIKQLDAEKTKITPKDLKHIPDEILLYKLKQDFGPKIREA